MECKLFHYKYRASKGVDYQTTIILEFFTVDNNSLFDAMTKIEQQKISIMKIINSLHAKHLLYLCLKISSI